MREKINVKICCSIWLVFFSTFSLKAQEATGVDVIAGSRKAIYKGVKQKDVRGFYLKKAVTLATGRNKEKEVKSKDMRRASMEKEVSISFPDQIKLRVKGSIPTGTEAESYIFTDLTANKGRIRFLNTSVVEGEKSSRRIRCMETVEHVQSEVWADVFPLLLDFAWDKERQYKYLGKAKVGSNRVDMVEMLPTKEEHSKYRKTKTEASTKLFFDERSKLLRMILIIASNKDGKQSAKYFFSDYQEMSGLLVAKKINADFFVMGKDGSKQRTIQNITVKDFKINPVFKEGTFDVKK